MTGPYYTVDTLRADNSIGYLLKRCGILVSQIAERSFVSQPVSFTQWAVLAQLTLQPHMTPTELRKNLGLDLGALTRIVDDLLGKRLVSRERSDMDRRAVRVALTAEGRRLAKAGMPTVVRLNNGLVNPLSRTETDALISLLQRVLTHFESVAGGSASAEESHESALHSRATARRAPAARRRGNS
jgi:DNA-binding MarR family transcriptional regulator